MMNYWFSPLNAVAHTDKGPSKLTIHNKSGYAIWVSSSSAISASDRQCIDIGLPLPEGLYINGVGISYKVNSASVGRSYISQTRLTQMTTPDKAYANWDDVTDLTSTTPTTYNSIKGGFKTGGAITLTLVIVIGDTADTIEIGGIQLKTK